MGNPVAASEDMAPIAAALNGFEQVSVTTTAATLASLLTGAVIPPDASHAIFYPEDQDVRWRADGTSPTSLPQSSSGRFEVITVLFLEE